MRKQIVSCAAVAVLAMPVALSAAGKVEQKTQVQFGGVIGGIVNAFGGKAAREGVTTQQFVKGNRKSTVSGQNAEIIDLDQEKIYRLDYGRKTVKVTTFEELRKQMRDAQKQAAEDREESPKKSDGPEYEVDVDIKETGKKETINGFNTKNVIVTVTVREKGKKLEQSGGAVMTADMWMGPRVAALREMEEFDRRYVQKLYEGTISGADMRQMAMLMATAPQFAKAMQKFQEKRSAFDGSAIRTNLKFETVAGANAKAEEEDESTAATKAIAGLLGRMKKKDAASEEKASAPGRSTLFSSTNEVLSASGSATDMDVAVPGDLTVR